MSSEAIDALLVAVAIMLTAWIPCALFVFRYKRVPLYHPVSMFLIYYAIGYIYAAFSDWYIARAPVWEVTGVFPTSGEIIWTAAASAIGLVTFVVAPVIALPGGLDKLKMPATRLIPRRPIPFWLTAILVAILGLISARFTFIGIGSESTLGFGVTALNSGGFASNVSGYATFAVQFFPAVLVVLFLYKGPTIPNILILALYIGFRAYAGAERSGFVFLGMAFLLAIMMRNQIRSLRVSHFAIMLILLGLFDLVGGDRLAGRALFSGTTSVSEIVAQYEANRGQNLPFSDLHEFDSNAIVVDVVPDKGGYNWFTQYLRLFIWPIPRQWWPDKPILTGRVNFTQYGMFFGQAITPSIMGDSYSNLGLPSLVLILALYSIGTSYLYRLATKTKSAAIFIIFFVIDMYLPLHYRDGEVGAYFFVLTTLLGSLPLVWIGGMRIERIQSIGARFDQTLWTKMRALSRVRSARPFIRRGGPGEKLGPMVEYRPPKL